MKRRSTNRIHLNMFIFLVLMILGLCGCSETLAETVTYADRETDPSLQKGTRDNEAVVLIPDKTGEILSCPSCDIDLGGMKDGYFSAFYHGECSKVKLQVTGPDGVTYTYDIRPGQKEILPFSAGNGKYTVGVYENIEGTAYSVALSEETDVDIESEFGPFLYPNMYCMFDGNTSFVGKSEDLAYPVNSDLELVTNIFNYVIKNMTYDKEKAETVESGYVCNLDETYKSMKGICLDFSAVMTCMLRAQGIPTKLDVGYAGKAYHAWISTYIEDVGWVNGIIEFDGENWSLMDPTFSASSGTDELASFIGDGTNYTVKYVY